MSLDKALRVGHSIVSELLLKMIRLQMLSFVSIFPLGWSNKRLPVDLRLEAPRTSRNKFHDWLEKTIEQTNETKDNNPETIEVRVFKKE